MIERKIIVTGCGNCPFVKYIIGDFVYSRHVCSKYNVKIDKPYDEEETHPSCMLPINIKSENI